MLPTSTLPTCWAVRRRLGPWEAFYERMTSVHGLNPKVVLEGVSRGGLFVYRWAKAHSETVACIYCDTPVCDFKSWPGGKGAGMGAEGEWHRLIREYGFVDEAEAMVYPDQPLDNLGPIVEARIPIMHIVTEDDAVVPPLENTYVLKQRLEELGHPFFYVISLEKGKGARGHHFDLRHPEIDCHFMREFSDFGNPYPVYLRGGLDNARHVFTTTGKGRVAFLGGSITEMAGWRDHVADSLRRCFPDTEFDFVFAGIGSTDSTMGAFRLERDIFSRGRVDLLFIESAVNELHNGRTRTEIIRAVEGILLHARRHNPVIDIVAQYLHGMPYVESYRDGRTPWQIAAPERIAIQHGINAIDQARHVTTLFDSGATCLEALAPGTELSVRFTGTTIGLPMVAGPDVGVIEWQVDDGEWKSLDQFTQWSRNLHIPWIHMLETELPDGPHLLRLRTTDRKNAGSTGYACRFRYFAVNGDVPAGEAKVSARR